MLISTVVFSQLNRTTDKIYEKELEYKFKEYVTIDLSYSSDMSLYCMERQSKADANKEISTISSY
jgi:hypothetical protein